LTKGRIAAAHGRYSLYFIMGCPFLPSKLPLPMGIWTPWAYLTPKRHFDRFSHFARLTTVTNWKTDRQTDRQTMLLGLWQQAVSTCVVLQCGPK